MVFSQPVAMSRVEAEERARRREGKHADAMWNQQSES